MAYMTTHLWPGATEEQYRTTLAAVHPDGLPEGQTHHFAASTDEGVLICAVWRSKDDQDRFLAEVLMPALPVEGGVSGQPQERSGEVINQQQA